MTIDAMVDAVRDFLDDEGWKYAFEAEHGFIRTGFALNCKLRSARLIIDFKPHGIIAYGFSPINADKDNPAEMIKYLTMANYKLLNGNFEMDLSDGEIRYKVWTSTQGLETLPKEMIDDLIGIPVSMLKRYGDGIAALAMGFSDAETEIKKAEGDGEASEEDSAGE